MRRRIKEVTEKKNFVRYLKEKRIIIKHHIPLNKDMINSRFILLKWCLDPFFSSLLFLYLRQSTTRGALFEKTAPLTPHKSFLLKAVIVCNLKKNLCKP
jgi:hypothetical protein